MDHDESQIDFGDKDLDVEPKEPVTLKRTIKKCMGDRRFEIEEQSKKVIVAEVGEHSYQLALQVRQLTERQFFMRALEQLVRLMT